MIIKPKKEKKISQYDIEKQNMKLYSLEKHLRFLINTHTILKEKLNNETKAFKEACEKLEIKEIKRIKDGKPLEKKQEKNDDYLATTGEGRKKGKKKKMKEINKDEVDLNNLIGANLQIGGGETMGRRPRKQDYRKGKKGEEKFVFKEEDFPEL